VHVFGTVLISSFAIRKKKGGLVNLYGWDTETRPTITSIRI